MPPHAENQAARVLAVRVLGALILVSGLVSCAGKQDEQPASPQEVAESTELLARLYESTWGDVADRRAVALLGYATAQGEMMTCVAKAGQTYYPPPFDDPHLGQIRTGPPAYYPEIVPASVEDAAVHGFGLGERAERYLNLAISRDRAPWDTVFNPNFATMSPEQRREYESVLGDCTPRDLFGGNHAPAGAEELSLALHDVVATVVRQPEIKRLSADYPDCMAAAGFPTAAWDELIVEMTKAFDGPVYVGHPPNWRTAATTPAWAALRERERQMAVADARCREEVHALVMTKLRPLLERFRDEHEVELAQLATQWAAVRQEADAITLPLR